MGSVPDYCNGTGFDFPPLDLDPLCDSTALKLEQVSLFFRHGARTGTKELLPCWKAGTPPTPQCKPVGDEAPSFWQMDRSDAEKFPYFMPEKADGDCQEPGMLTQAGWDQHLQNGQALIKSLEALNTTAHGEVSTQDFLEALRKWEAGDLYLRSTNVTRTFQSLQAILTGMAQQSGRLEDTHFKVLTYNITNDTMTRTDPEVERLVKAMGEENPKWTPEFTSSLQKLGEVLNHKEILNWDKPDYEIFKHVWQHFQECYYTDVCPNTGTPVSTPKLPEGVNADNLLKQGSDILQHVWQSNTNLRVAVLKDLLLDWQDRWTQPPKLLVYSGHDNDPMFQLRVALNSTQHANAWPKFASMITVQRFSGKACHSDETSFFRLLDSGQELSYAGCLGPHSTLCPESVLKTLLKASTEEPASSAAPEPSLSAVLQGGQTTVKYEPSHPMTSPNGLILIILLVVLFCLFGSWHRRREASRRFNME